MEPDEDQYQRESDCEQYADYAIDGYHPVAFGQRFNAKYVVHQKLGWGHFSTVWLVNNDKTNQYMALKIQRSKQTHAQTAIDQLQMLQTIRKHEGDEGWVNFVKEMAQRHPTLVNEQLYNFIHHGIHGKHYCTVFELMGPNLLDLIQHYQFKNKKMPLWLVRKITIDVLMGLVNLHQFSKMIHTDLKPQNIMMKLHPQEQEELIRKLKQYPIKPISMKFLKNLQSSKSNKNKKKYQKKKLKKAKQNQNKQQSQSIQPSNNDDASIQNTTNKQINQIKIKCNNLQSNQQQTQIINQQSNNQINHQQINIQQKENNQKQEKNTLKLNNQKENQQSEQQMKILKWKNVKIKLNNDVFYKIADMGNACYIQKQFTDTIQTRQYRSPQVLLGHAYQTNTDIWSLGCTVFQMMTNSFLFKPKKVQGISKDEDHLFRMIEVLGPMKKQFATEGKYSGDFFNKKGKLLHGNPKQQIRLSQLLHEDFGYNIEEAEQAQKFLLPMLEFEPKNRISARKCLENEWLWKN